MRQHIGITNTLTETEILALINKKDPTAYCRLYKKYSPLLFGQILKLTTNITIAVKVLEASILKIWLTIHTYDTSISSLYTWMLSITIKECSAALDIPYATLIRKMKNSSLQNVKAAM